MPVISISSNIPAETAKNRLSRTTGDLRRTAERLASGQRINRAVDDAAGLSISAALRADVRVFSQALRNVNDAVSLINIVDAALAELSQLVLRQRELAEQAANGIYSDNQRAALDDEANALVDEYNRILETTEMNGLPLLDGSFENVRFQAGYGLNGGIALSIGDALAVRIADGGYLLEQTIADSALAAIVAADFNGDGASDFAVSRGSAAIEMRVYLNDGTGSSFTQQSFGHASPNSGDIHAADFDADGDLDLMTVEDYNGTVTYFSNDGSGGFSLEYQGATVGAPTSAAVGDFNGDGNLDFATAVGGSLGLVAGNGDGTFQAPVTTVIPGAQPWISSADFDNDGVTELVLASSTGIRIYAGSPSGSFTELAFYGVPGSRIRTGDVNGDGLADVAYASGSNVSIQLGNGDGTLGSPATYAVSGSINDLRLSDLNGDGRADVITSGAGIDVRFADESGALGARRSSAGIGGGAMDVGDVDRDGVADVMSVSGAGIDIAAGTSVESTRVSALNLRSQAAARTALDLLGTRLSAVARERGNIGAALARLEVAASNVQTAALRSTDADSRIVDADIAEESSLLTRSSIIQQAGAAVLAQAKEQPRLALLLVQSA